LGKENVKEKISCTKDSPKEKKRGGVRTASGRYAFFATNAAGGMEGEKQATQRCKTLERGGQSKKEQ